MCVCPRKNGSVATGGKCQVSSWCCQRNLLPCNQPGLAPTSPSVLLRIQKAVPRPGSPQGTDVIWLLRHLPRKESIIRDSLRAENQTVSENAINWRRWESQGELSCKVAKTEKYYMKQQQQKRHKYKGHMIFFLTKWRLLDWVKTLGEQSNQG